MSANTNTNTVTFGPAAVFVPSIAEVPLLTLKCATTDITAPVLAFKYTEIARSQVEYGFDGDLWVHTVSGRPVVASLTYMTEDHCGTDDTVTTDAKLPAEFYNPDTLWTATLSGKGCKWLGVGGGSITIKGVVTERSVNVVNAQGFQYLTVSITMSGVLK